MKIRINPLFYVTVLICCIFGNPITFVITYISLTVHELVHLYFLHREKICTEGIVLEPFGICIKTKAMGGVNPAVYLSAPLFNVFLSFVFYYLFKRTYNSLFLTASAANLALGSLNLLPILPFDGGRALMCRVKNKGSVVFFSAAGGILIFLCGVLLFFKSGFNFSLIMTGIFITANSISENEQIFERSVIMSKDGLSKKLTGKMKTEIISAPWDYSAHKLLSSFNTDSFHIINIIKDGTVLGTVTETLIIDGIINGKTLLKDFI